MAKILTNRLHGVHFTPKSFDMLVMNRRTSYAAALIHPLDCSINRATSIFSNPKSVRTREGKLY